MKKVLFGLGVLAVLSFPVVGEAYGESQSDSEFGLKYTFPTTSYDDLHTILRDYCIDSGQELYGPKQFNLLDIGNSDNNTFKKFNYDLFYPLSIEKMNNASGEFIGEMFPYNADFMKYFHSLDEIYFEGAVTDLRPLENSKNITSLELYVPITTFGFIKKYNNLEKIVIIANNKLENESDDTIKVLNDISFLSNLSNLKDIEIKSNIRPFPTISFKKSMNKYVLVNPFVLSKQFKNPEVKITSETPGFTFEDDILTWDGITPDTKELQISWKFSSKENGDFEFSGDSVIPINWID